MELDLLKPVEITEAETGAWRELQRRHPGLESPFFCPEFAALVAESRSDVEVAVIRDGGRPVGFLPFHRDRRDVGTPVGQGLSDFHGVIAGPDAAWQADKLIRGCGLRAWRFNHLIATQVPFHPHHWARAESPYLDLSHGFEAYRANRIGAGSRLFEQMERKARKAEREQGPIRFEWHTRSSAVFAALLRWKSAQRARTRTLDVLQGGWVRDLLERIRCTETSGFACVLSALYVGEDLWAAHLGLRSETVLHLWFPAFERSYSRNSPGMILLLEMARAAPSQGIERIDLGKGDEHYKRRLMSGSLELAEGAVEFRRATKAVRQTLRNAKGWIRVSPFAGVARALKPVVRGCREWTSRQRGHPDYDEF
jgi:CelD/BcsL family acetyltransferase involved in cellulose biosynthesis